MDSAHTDPNCLDETDPLAFEFHDDGWVGGTGALRLRKSSSARHDFAHSFGSCSFEEPVNDLRALGLLK